MTALHTNRYPECLVHEYTIFLSTVWADRYIVTSSEFIEGDKSFYSAFETLKRQMLSITSGMSLDPISCDRLLPIDRIDLRILHFTLIFQGHENVGFCGFAFRCFHFSINLMASKGYESGTMAYFPFSFCIFHYVQNREHEIFHRLQYAIGYHTQQIHRLP